MDKPKKDLRYLEYNFDGKKLFIMKHHAIALKCWKKSLDEKIISTIA